MLYLKLNETQKAFDRLLEVIQFDKNCLRGLMAFGAILQVKIIFFMLACYVIAIALYSLYRNERFGNHFYDN